MGPHQCQKRVRVERLSQIAVRSRRQHTLGKHVVCGNEDDRRCVASGYEKILKIESTQAAEVDIEDDALRQTDDGAADELLRGAEGFHANSVTAKGSRERSA